jgi:hypothetical protein
MRHSFRITLTSLFLAAIFLFGSAIRCWAAPAAGGHAAAGPAASSLVSEQASDWLAALWLVFRLQASPASAFTAQANGHIFNNGNHFREQVGARKPGRFYLDVGCGINPNGGCS